MDMPPATKCLNNSRGLSPSETVRTNHPNARRVTPVPHFKPTFPLISNLCLHNASPQVHRFGRRTPAVSPGNVRLLTQESNLRNDIYTAARFYCRFRVRIIPAPATKDRNRKTTVSAVANELLDKVLPRGRGSIRPNSMPRSSLPLSLGSVD